MRHLAKSKTSVTPTKELVNQRDLALAYSPGVAAACDAIVEDPREAQTLTSRGNLVAVITNGTTVLGLGFEARFGARRTAGGVVDEVSRAGLQAPSTQPKERPRGVLSQRTTVTVELA
jgi:hypothetical protein